MNLREAIEQGNLKKFISEHKGDKGDKAAFDTTLDSMAGKSKATREASSRDGSDD